MYDNVWLHHYYCYCGRIWSDSSLLQFIEVCRCSFMHSSLKVSMSVMLRSTHDCAIVAPWFFSFTTKGSLSWSMIQFRPRFSCQTDGLTFDSRILEVQTPGSAVGMSCVCWNVVFLVVWLHFLHFFSRHGDENYGLTSPLWFHLCKGDCFKSLVVYSNAAL